MNVRMDQSLNGTVRCEPVTTSSTSYVAYVWIRESGFASLLKPDSEVRILRPNFRKMAGISLHNSEENYATHFDRVCKQCEEMRRHAIV